MTSRWILSGLLALFSAACASTGAVSRPLPAPAAGGREGPAAPVQVRPTTRKFDGKAIAGAALSLRGIRYRLGGADPAGFDCSGLVRYVFAQYGVDVPRLVQEQYRVGRKVKPAGIKAGDLLFFSTKGRGATHVAIAIGDNRFVHAPTSNGVVRIEALSSGYWGSRYVGARRIIAHH